MNHSFRSARRRMLVATALLGAVLPLAVSSAGAAPTKTTWQLDGKAGAEIVSGLEYYDRGAIVVVPSGRGGPRTDAAVTITSEDLQTKLDFIGRHLASGDIDGDGYGDLLTSGTDYSAANGSVRTLLVVPGGPDGPDVASAYTVTSDGPGIGGRVLAADLDRDGLTDVVAQSGTVQEPAATILWGNEEGLTLGGAMQIDAPGQRRFGELMAAGNVDGDRKRELLLGQGGRIPDNEGHSRVRGFLTVCDVTARRNVSCAAPLRIAAGAHTLAVGDFAGGNAEEVVVGEPVTSGRDDDPNRPAVWLYRATADGLATPPVKLTRDSQGIPGTHTEYSGWGSALAAGDVDGDGKDELVVGAPGEKRGGQLTVLFGARRGPGATDRDQTINQATAGIAGMNEQGDGFGAGLSLLDVTGDGSLDLLAGVPGEDRMMGSITIIPSGEGRFATRRSVRIEADELGLDPERGEISLGWVLGQ